MQALWEVLLVRMVIEGDHGTHQRMPLSAHWTREDEELLHTGRGDPAHQATWDAFMFLLAIRHFVSVLKGDALGVWCGMVRMRRSIRWPKRWHFIWLNVVADALSRMGEHGQSCASQGRVLEAHRTLRVDVSEVFEGGSAISQSLGRSSERKRVYDGKTSDTDDDGADTDDDGARWRLKRSWRQEMSKQILRKRWQISEQQARRRVRVWRNLVVPLDSRF